MKNLQIVIFLLFLFEIGFAQTHVSGRQSGVWTKANSPYLVVGEIHINSQDTLIIEPGVDVIFQGYYKVNVYGTLLAIGEIQDSILFTASDSATGWGGIRFVSTSTLSKFIYCIFEYGKTGLDYPDNNGGAISLIASDAVISHSLFRYNDATGDDDGMGGAIYGNNTGSSPTSEMKISNCVFIGNHAFGEGGAIKLTADLNSVIDSCKFIGNNSLYGGGAISLYSVFKTRIKNSLFYNNFTQYGSGGAIESMGYGSSFYLINSTIYGNEARGGDGGGVYLTYTIAEIVNSIIWGNNGMYSNNIYLDFDSSAKINYCDTPMPDGVTGSNNINADPLFTDTNNLDFSLTPHSPCVDSATDLYIANGDTLVNITEYYGSAPDIGAYEFYPPGEISENEIVRTFKLYQNYPNPFNPATTIDYSIPNVGASEQNVQLKIYDVLGREVATLVNEKQSYGNYSIKFDAGKLNSGIYFYTLRAGNFIATKKMILMK